jgi:tRNA dimethylallyltransferase
MNKVICLMGPTAAGKTPLAVELVQQFPLEIISVDSAMVYKGMDIGTAKPDADTLKIAPHRLIDLCDPSEAYSAGQFRDDALHAIADITAKGKIPLLVGGTMLYFRVLTQGLAQLPKADKTLREQIEKRAERNGWEALHAELAKIDNVAAARIHPNDAQRISRALEVYYLTDKTITALQREQANPLSNYEFINFAIAPNDRALLHERIKQRFEEMLQQGFVEEVRELYDRGDLTADLPSIRSVGYRQLWQHVAGHESYDEACNKAFFATRQLAKRQLTWLRSWPDVTWLTTGETKEAIDIINNRL